MSWNLSPSFTAACERGDQSLQRYSRSRLDVTVARVRDLRRRHRPRCPGGDPALASMLDDAISDLLRGRGLPSDSTGGAPPMLWCLGGPEVLRPFEGEASEFTLSPDDCVDLNAYVCGKHRLLACDLWPFDLADWSAERNGTRSAGRQPPVTLAEDWPGALEAFTALVDELLTEVLAPPGEAGGDDARDDCTG